MTSSSWWRAIETNQLRALAMGTALLALLTLVGCSSAPRQAPGKPWHHLADGRFRNLPGGAEETVGLADMIGFIWRRLRADEPPTPADYVIPVTDAIEAFSAAAGIDSVTWLGHASFLLRVSGTVILTDPYLSDVAGPFGFGPERHVAPGLPLEALPPVDIVVVSHNHYDHLDAETLVALPDKDRVQVVVPLGLGEFFLERGYQHVHERDWYEQVTLGDIEVEVLPAMHFSRRGLLDRNRTLWSGFAIRGGGRRIYHSGDTGYGPVFGDIGKRAGPFDLALVAIGAYAPRSIMQAAHVTPEEAVDLVDDIGADVAVGMHWGTVALTDEPLLEPPARFIAAARAAGWPCRRARVMRIGETLSFDRLNSCSEFDN